MSLQQITGGGVFSKANINALNQNFSALTVPDVWVRPQYGSNSGNGSVKYSHGSYENAFASLAGLANVIEPGIVIGLQGVLFEEYSSPIVNDVTILGMGNQPRQATTSGAANGGGATWLSPASGASTHLAILRGQAWTLQNLYMNNTTASKACVQILISGGGDPPTDPSAEHTRIRDCYFTGAKYGVLSTGGANWCTLENNTFFGFADSGDVAVFSETGEGVHSLYGWRISGNRFRGNANHIDIAPSGAEIDHNSFSYIDNGVTTTTQIVLTGGLNNSVHDNYFDLPHNTNGISAMFAGGTNDRWYFNQFATAVTTTIYAFSVPAS